VGIFVCENKLKKSLKLFFYYKKGITFDISNKEINLNNKKNGNL